MKYEDMIDMEKVDEKIAKLAHLFYAGESAKDDCVKNALWDAYDAIVEELIDLIVNQWCESVYKGKGE